MSLPNVEEMDESAHNRVLPYRPKKLDARLKQHSSGFWNTRRDIPQHNRQYSKWPPGTRARDNGSTSVAEVGTRPNQFPDRIGISHPKEYPLSNQFWKVMKLPFIQK